MVHLSPTRYPDLDLLSCVSMTRYSRRVSFWYRSMPYWIFSGAYPVWCQTTVPSAINYCCTHWQSGLLDYTAVSFIPS